MLSTQDIIFITAAAVIIFGAKKIPEVAKSIGVGIREFKKALNPESEQQVYQQKENNIKRYNPARKKTTRKRSTRTLKKK